MFKYLKKLLYILPASKLSLLLAASIFIMSSFIEALGIGMIGPFISLASDFNVLEQTPILVRIRDVLGITNASSFVAIVGLLAVVVFVSKTCSAWLTQVFITRFSDRQQRLLIIKMVRNYLNAPYVYHIEKNSSSIIDRLIEIANAFSNTIFMPLLTTLANIFLFTAIFTLLCFTSLSTMLGLLVVLFPVLFFFNSFAPKVRNWGKQMRESKADIIQTVNHAFGSIKETKVIACEDYFEEQISNQARKLETSHRTFIAFRILPRFVLECVIVVSIISLISISVLLNGEGISGTTSILGVFAVASIRLLPAISNSINGVNQLRASSYTVDQVYFELLELESLISEQEKSGSGFSLSDSSHETRISLKDDTKKQLRSYANESKNERFKFRKGIELEHITFRYPNSIKDVIFDLSISIKKGESVAFIGKSGAGKTTLVDIILSLVIPQSGDLKVDGLSIYSDLKAWKNLIAYIPQTIFLTDESIRKNIAFGVPEHLIDEVKLAKAIQVAQLTDVVDDLSDGLYTLVGERGILLSGGQRQRVGIARAIYHDREILILDEATAALDNETEKLVTDSITSLSLNSNITLITIAHRLTTIKGCDRIYMLNEGQIIKSGQFCDVVDNIEI